MSPVAALALSVAVSGCTGDAELLAGRPTAELTPRASLAVDAGREWQAIDAATFEDARLWTIIQTAHRLFVGGSAGGEAVVWRSSDAVDWDPARLGDGRVLHLVETASGVVAAGSSGFPGEPALWFSADGTDWERRLPCNGEMNTIDSLLVGDSSLLLAGSLRDGVGVCRLDAEGWHILQADVMDGAYVVDLRILDDGRTLAIGIENFFGGLQDAGPDKQRAVAWVSADSGDSWEETWRAEDNGFVSAVAADEHDRLWLVGARVEVAATLEFESATVPITDEYPLIWQPVDDGGWSDIDMGETGRANDLVVTPAGVLVVGTTGQRVRDTAPVAWVPRGDGRWSAVALPSADPAQATGVVEWADGYVAIGHASTTTSGRIWISPATPED